MDTVRDIAQLPRKLRGLSPETVEDLSRLKGEPAWMRQQRREAWYAFDAMPMPSLQDEDWRRTDLSGLDLGAFAPFRGAPYQAASTQDLPRPLCPLLGRGGEYSGLLVQHDSQGVLQALDQETAGKGIIFSHLDGALQEYPDLVRRYFFGEALELTHTKFTALNGAIWSGGAFLYVPEGVEVSLPLRSILWSAGSGLTLAPHTIIVLERGSKVNYVDEYLSAPGQRGAALHCGVVEVYLKEEAEIRYLTIQQWGREMYNLSVQRVLAGANAKADFVLAATGGGLTKTFIEAALSGQGAQSHITGILFGDGAQHFDHQVLQDHLERQTTGSVLFKVALTDRARSVFLGLARVHKRAKLADSYLENRNLILGEHAKADSIPKLEIEASDIVRCGHGSTVGQVDEQQLFYLMSRGLSRLQAEKVILDGFFAPVLERIPLEAVRQRLAHILDRKFARRLAT